MGFAYHAVPSRQYNDTNKILARHDNCADGTTQNSLSSVISNKLHQ